MFNGREAELVIEQTLSGIIYCEWGLWRWFDSDHGRDTILATGRSYDIELNGICTRIGIYMGYAEVIVNGSVSEIPRKYIIVVNRITSIGEDEVVVDLALSVFIDGESGNGILVNGNDEGCGIGTSVSS